MNCTVNIIMAAAGKGTRAAQDINKVYADLCGKAVLVRSILPFLQIPQVKLVIVVISKDDVDLFNKIVLKDESLIHVQSKIKYVIGGNTRQESVYNGLQNIDKDVDLVAIHDGARPLILKEDIISVMEIACKTGAAFLGVKVKDTIKQINAQKMTVKKTLKREELIAVQTPQIFQKDIIVNAYAKAVCNKAIASDDTTLVEWAGYPVYMVEGSYENIKITTPEDFIIARSLLDARNR